MSEANELPKPSFGVVSGNPTSEELAVVVAVLQAAAVSASASTAGERNPPVSSWSRNTGLLRGPVRAGQGQWRAAYRSGLTR